MFHLPSGWDLAPAYHQINSIPALRGLGVQLQPDHLPVGFRGPALLPPPADDPVADSLLTACRRIVLALVRRRRDQLDQNQGPHQETRGARGLHRQNGADTTVIIIRLRESE